MRGQPATEELASSENAEKESDVRVATGVWQVQRGIGESASQPRGILRHGVRSAPREVAEVPFPDLLLCRFLLLLKTSAKVPTRDDSHQGKARRHHKETQCIPQTDGAGVGKDGEPPECGGAPGLRRVLGGARSS